MRFTLVLAVAALITPPALAADPVTSGMQAAHAVSDVSAAKKKKAAKKAKEEYLKAAPGTGPSGPTKY